MKRKKWKLLASVLLALTLFFTGIPGMETMHSKAASASIPSGAKYYKGNYYYIYYDKSGITWANAKTACEKKGGHLATITTSGEQKFISDLLYGYGKSWFGLKYENGKVVWVTGEKVSYKGPGDSEMPNNAYPYGYIYGGGSSYNGCWDHNYWDTYSYNYTTIYYYICEWEGNLKETLPDQVTGLSVKKASSTAVTVSWKKVGDAEGYVVYMKTGSNGSWKKIATNKKKNLTTLYQSGLKKGKTYYFRVRAYKTIYGERSYGELSIIKSIKMK